MEEKEIPVYLFLGFLDSGKTKFIQETFEDERFDSGENTLLLVAEEGEEEYDPSRFAVKKFAVEQVNEQTLNLNALVALENKHRPDRVVIEYNGMLELQKFFDKYFGIRYMQSPGIVLLPLIHFPLQIISYYLFMNKGILFFPLHTNPIPERLCMELLQYIISFPFPFILINFTLFSSLRTF